jgi:hyperosmotically inducible periplasmic protein
MKNTIFTLAACALVATAGCERAPSEHARGPTPTPSTTVAARPDAAPNPPAAADAASRTVPRDAISDSVITTRVKAGILSDPGMAGSDVSVNTDRGVVSLTGLIKSQEQAAIASAHAQRQDGVMRVDNQLAVNLH